MSCAVLSCPSLGVCVPHQGMKKRVGFQFNALEDTVESIGLEMVEQLALNTHQVGHRHTLADVIAWGVNTQHTRCQ